MKTTTEQKVAINKGANLLDEKGPRNWWEKINLDRLDMSCLENCVLGQLYQDYGKGLTALKQDGGVNHGFSQADVACSDAPKWVAFTNYWKLKIRQRRAKHAKANAQSRVSGAKMVESASR